MGDHKNIIQKQGLSSISVKSTCNDDPVVLFKVPLRKNRLYIISVTAVSMGEYRTVRKVENSTVSEIKAVFLRTVDAQQIGGTDKLQYYDNTTSKKPDVYFQISGKSVYVLAKAQFNPSESSKVYWWSEIKIKRYA